MEIPRVMLGSRFGFWLMPWIVEMATSARWIPYCSLCVQQPFQNLKIIDHIGFLILWDELYHCFLTPSCSGSEVGHLLGVLRLYQFFQNARELWNNPRTVSSPPSPSLLLAKCRCSRFLIYFLCYDFWKLSLEGNAFTMECFGFMIYPPWWHFSRQ